MIEYVPKDAVRQMLGNRYGGFLLELDAMPAADVAPVAHGKWVFKFEGPYKRKRVIVPFVDSIAGLGVFRKIKKNLFVRTAAP